MNASKKAIPDLNYLLISNEQNVHYQLSVAELVERALARGEGRLSDTGALVVDTGRFTGRTPYDRFIVRDAVTEKTVWWGNVNQPLAPTSFEYLFKEVSAYLSKREIFVRDAIAGSDPRYQIEVRVITETAYQSLFAHNLFIRPVAADPSMRPEWSILVAPGFSCTAHAAYGLHNPNFVVTDFRRKIILIAGTGYAGEIKKSVFSVLNYLLPLKHEVLSMHCSANTDGHGHTALFFGLSGTGKTTLSADGGRLLVGDDEHGWHENGIFNFEGGCYAKCAGLDPEKEPDIFAAVQFGALAENVRFRPGTRTPDYSDTSKTENTRVAYPIHYVSGSVATGRAVPPDDVFFLTADAFGVIPPVSLLSTTQAMYHFLSGYTAKVAGTEVGIKEPTAVFSACFGEAFLPLHPIQYAELLRARLEESQARVWLINTGWIAGPYGIGRRIKLDYTRAIIRAALAGELREAAFKEDPVFQLRYPTSCPGVPGPVLDPIQLWPDQSSYYAQANQLARRFMDNFKRFEGNVSADVLATGPAVLERFSVK